MGWKLTPPQRTSQQVRAEQSSALHRVLRMARVLTSGMEQVDRGLYRIEPGDVLALRAALDRAEKTISNEGSST